MLEHEDQYPWYPAAPYVPRPPPLWWQQVIGFLVVAALCLGSLYGANYVIDLAVAEEMRPCANDDDLLSYTCQNKAWRQRGYQPLVFFEPCAQWISDTRRASYDGSLTLFRVTINLVLTVVACVAQLVFFAADMACVVMASAVQLPWRLTGGASLPWPVCADYVTAYYFTMWLEVMTAPMCLAANHTACAFPVYRHDERRVAVSHLFTLARTNEALRSPSIGRPMHLVRVPGMDYLVSDTWCAKDMSPRH